MDFTQFINEMNEILLKIEYLSNETDIADLAEDGLELIEKYTDVHTLQ